MSANFNNIISAFNDNFDGDAEEEFTSGRCAEFALALALYAQRIGFKEAYVSIIFRDEIDAEDEEVYAINFSHAIACIDGECYDINGNEADERWVSDFSDEPNKWNLYDQERYEDIYDISATELPVKLAEECTNHKVPLDMQSVILICDSFEEQNLNQAA